MIKRLVLRLLVLVGIAVVIGLGVVQYLAIEAIDRAIDEAAPVAAAPKSAMVGPREVRLSSPRPVIFVGNNWQGTVTVIDGENHAVLGVLNGIPDKVERLREIREGFVRRMAFYGIRKLIGEGNDQYVDDMYSTTDGSRLIVSRPSFADVIALDVATGKVIWRFTVAGLRSDHMALSPDGKQVAVSASTGNVVHLIDIDTGAEVGQFPTGDSPHENVYSKDGSKIFHASIGRVFTPFDLSGGGLLKGRRLFQIVDKHSLKILERFDMKEKLEAKGLGDISPAIRPMAHTSDEQIFYFQLSFLHGFVEYDLRRGEVSRLVDLPQVTTAARTDYVNDSAHHGIAISGDDKRLCVAGTMDDYVAIVDLESLEPTILDGLGSKPYWAVTDKTGEFCYVSWSGSDQMSIIRYETSEEILRIDVGDHPQRVREGFVTDAWAS